LNKLFKFKEYLTLEQAAEYLTTILEEPVSVADVLQLALDKHITLSVHFVNHATARPGKIVTYTVQEIAEFATARDYVEDLNWLEDLTAVFDAKAASRPCPDPIPKIMCSQRLGESQWLTFTDKVVTLSGIWDLPMIGNEVHDVEFEFQALTGGPEVGLINIDGTFVVRQDGSACKLLQKNDESDKSAMRRERVLDDYFPAGGLPEDAVLVVRPSALKALEMRLTDTPETADVAAMGTREKRTNLVIIAALCKAANIDRKAPGAAKKIEALTELLGAKVSEETIKNKILDHIEEAIESRVKV
jgi:hypothetical protein